MRTSETGRVQRAAAPAAAQVFTLRDLKAHCSSCSMRELCLPVGLAPDEIREIEALVGKGSRHMKGAAIYRAGDAFAALHAIRVGSAKTMILAEDGREQVAGYHLQGEIVGLDGIASGRHGCTSIALEDTDACVLPFAQIEELARAVPALQRNLHHFLAGEISRDQSMMLLLGSMRAEERLAAFLQNIADRYRRRGYSSTEFVLRMTREEIGSLLGLTLETVSRLFSRFQSEGLIMVQGRSVKLLDTVALKQLIGPRC